MITGLSLKNAVNNTMYENIVKKRKYKIITWHNDEVEVLSIYQFTLISLNHPN